LVAQTLENLLGAVAPGGGRGRDRKGGKLQLDLTEFYRRFESHPTLGPVLRRWRGMRPLNHSSLYEYALGTTASSSPVSCKTPPFDAQST